MSAAEIIAIIVSAIIGGSGLCGLVFYFVRKYIEDALNRKKKEDEELRKIREKRSLLERSLQHDTGRLLFWIVRSIETGQHNGELKAAFEAYTEAEDQMKQFDYEILARNESE